MVLPFVLLCALPASGKSEVRKYLNPKKSLLTVSECENDFHMGETVQLDDYPYVDFMRDVDVHHANLGRGNLFFRSHEEPFANPFDWGTLIELLNEDYFDLLNKTKFTGKSAAAWLFWRIDAAAEKVGIKPRLNTMPLDVRSKMLELLEVKAARLLSKKEKGYVDSLEGKTIVAEFARGGADDSPFPIREPFGYQYSLSILHPAILAQATILYIWVSPEESRRKNVARGAEVAPGGNSASILHHSVPDIVMRKDYGCDDIDYLLKQAAANGRPGAVQVAARKTGDVYTIPLSRFDNRKDLTSFLRNPKEEWGAEERASVHNGLRDALVHLAKFAR